MALRVAEVITAARDYHPAFDPRNCPNGVAVRWLSDYQRNLVQKGHVLDRYWLAQQLTLYVNADPSAVPGIAGAGTGGGLPATIDAEGNVGVGESAAGALADLDFADTTPDFGPAVADVITTDALQFLGNAWTVNQWSTRGAYAVVVDGPGLGAARKILSNTADTVQFTAGEGWSNGQPTSGSRLAFLVVAPTVDGSRGLVTATPPLDSVRAYAVRLDAGGTPYVDVTKPLVMTIDAGIPLPPRLFISDIGVVRFTTTEIPPDTFRLVPPGQRQSAHFIYSGYVSGDHLFLVGAKNEWQSVVGIDLKYVPIPPALTAMSDLFLLPDHASEALSKALAAFFGRRLLGSPITPDLAGVLATDAAAAEQTFLETIGRRGRARTILIRDVR